MDTINLKLLPANKMKYEGTYQLNITPPTPQ